MTGGALANIVISSGDACRYGADGKRFDDTLSREISRVMLPVPSEGGDFSTPQRFRRNDRRRGPAFLKSAPEGRHHHPLNPLNLMNPLNPHTEGVSTGARQHRYLERGIYEKIVSRCLILPSA